MFKKALLLVIFLFLVLFTAQGQITRGYAARINETAAYRVLRNIGSSQATYSSSTGFGNYASTFQQLINDGYLDPTLASGEKYSYRFELFATNFTPQSRPLFHVTATPRQYSKSGRKSFYFDQDGFIHGADLNGATATINEPEFIICGDNETATILNLRYVGSAEATFSTSVGGGNYGNLLQLRAENYVGSILSSGQICGYNVSIQIGLANQTTQPTYRLFATP
jgi:hypothetical protein